MEEKIRLDKNSQLIVSKVVNVTFDNQGRRVKEFREFIANEPVSLGSIKNPLNEYIIAFEFRDTTPQPKHKNMFDF